MAGKKLEENKRFTKKSLYLVSLGELWDKPHKEGG